MATQIAVPVFCYAAPKLHQLNHTVTDAIPGFICTETTGADSFTQNSIIRCKEIRCDRNAGKIRTTQLIVSNKNQVLTGGVVADAAIYDDAGGVTTPQIVTFDGTENNAALVVKSGGAWIGSGAFVNGTLSATNVSISGTTTFTGVVNANGGLFVPTYTVPVMTTTTKIQTPEIDTGANVDLILKRNSTEVARIDAGGLTIAANFYLKQETQPRFCVGFGIATRSGVYGRLTNWLHEFFDNTNSFDVVEGKFTAPISGDYRFSLNSYSIVTSSASVDLKVNDANVSTEFNFKVNNSQTVTNKTINLSAILRLGAGDNVSIYAVDTYISEFTTFSGELLSII